MSHFYGTTQGERGVGTRTGHRSLVTHAAGWKGAVRVELTREGEVDRYRVLLTPWHGSGGVTRTLAEGVLDADRPAGEVAMEALRAAGGMTS